MTKNMGVYLGIDLGGTRIQAARFTPDGVREATESAPSEAQGNADKILDAINSAASQLVKNEALLGVGLGAAGLCDPERGRILSSPNIPALNGFDLKTRLQGLFGDTPILMMNDANAAALGEFHAGAGLGSSSMFLLTLGTGIGGGFVANGKILLGTAGFAAEAGHMSIQANGPLCRCGSRGCLEACVSGWAIVRDAEEIARNNPDSEIARLPSLTPLTLAKLARNGEPNARALWEKAGTMLGIGIANLMNLFNPECVVLVGGLGKAGSLLVDPARRTWENQVFGRAHQSTVVKMGTLGEWAGARGTIQPYLDS